MTLGRCAKMAKEYEAEMEELFHKAKKHGLWMYHRYQDCWFKPDELKELQKNGKFRWGGWETRNPSEREAELKKDVELAKERLRRFQERMKDFRSG